MAGVDAFSVYVMTALVVNVCGIVFIVDTVLRRDGGAGKVWALSFLSAMLMTVAYVIWDALPDAWWAVAVGNAALVAAGGLLWLGCRHYNGRMARWASWTVGAAVLGAAAAVLIDPVRGDWAGAVWMFVGIGAFALAGVIECARGDIAAQRNAWILAVVLAVQFAYFVARTFVFLTAGPDSDVFATWFGTSNTGMTTVVVSIVALAVLSVLRAARAPVRGDEVARSAEGGDDGIVTADGFARSLAALCTRAEERGELIAVIAVRVGDLEQISTAFGSDVARAVTEVWRSGVRAHAPSNALVGDNGSSGMSVGVLVGSSAEARRQAGAIYRGLFDDLGTVSGGVIPVLGIGVGMSSAAGHDATELIALAHRAAEEASRSVESSVLVGGEQ